MLLAFSGCAGTVPEGHFGCTSNTDCPTGWFCRADDRCYSTEGTPSDGGVPDGGRDGGSDRCGNEGECANGLFFDGTERCDPADMRADARGCVPGMPFGCGAGEVCDEIAGACAPACSTDRDGDSSISMACGGDDCDDDNPSNFPGNPETCDGRDNDCDGQIDADSCVGMACGAVPDPIAPAMLPACGRATQIAVRPADPMCMVEAVPSDPQPTLCGFCRSWQISVCAARTGCRAEYAAFACCWMTRGCAPGDFACVDVRCPEAFAQWTSCTVNTTPGCWDPDSGYLRQCFP